MPQDSGHAPDNADAFFAQARTKAQTQAFDEAIEAFLQGLRIRPEATEIHAELRRLAAQRRTAGGENPTDVDLNAYRQGQTALDKMLAAERLMCKHPEHLPYAQRLLRAAVSGGYTKTATWIADLIFLAMNRSGRPALEVYRMLKEAYLQIDMEERALLACKRILQMVPDDPDARASLRALSAKVKGIAKEPTESAVGAPPGKLGENGDIDSDASLDDPLPDPGPSEAIDTTTAAAQLFFDKGAKAAAGGSFDYAIEMYLEGLRRDPEALEQGHLPLAHIALQRQGHGGKKPSMMDRAKGLRAKTPLDQLLIAELLWTKDPSHIPYAEAMLKAAVSGQYYKTAHWLANLIFQTNNALERPSLQTYLLLKDSYRDMNILDKALAACQRALSLRPKDNLLTEEYKNLSAELTMAQGRYDQPGDFRKSIKDREKQELRYAQDRVVKTADWRALAVKKARKAYDADRDLSKNIHNLANALADLETDEGTNEAIAILREANTRLQDFSFLDRAGQLRIKQLRRQLRQTEENSEASEAIRRELAETEVEHYRLCVENYPTDPKFKYEYALRLSAQGHYDQAIPLFQEAQKDPGRRILAMNQIGLAFLAKEWLTDAVDVFTQAFKLLEGRDDSLAKELRYNLARTYEQQQETEKALDIYRKIAQSDFAYKDVSDRITKLRSA
jgi:tetratricopeptide (TPR) repeat protein